MKKITLSIAVLLFFISFVFGQAIPTEKTIGDYKVELDKISKLSKNVGRLDTYKKLQFKNKITEEIRGFKDLPIFEQRLFILFQKLKFEQTLKSVQDEWVADFKKLDKESDKGEASEPDTAIAKASHVSNYLDKFFVIRKSVAADNEKNLTQIFKEFPNKFDKKEIEFMLKRLKEMRK